MKLFFRGGLVIAFSIICFDISAKMRPAIFVEETAIDLMELMPDSSAGQIDHSNPTTKEINLTAKFQEIQILGDVTVILTNGSQDKLKMEGDSSDLEHVKVNIKSGKLRVSAENQVRSKVTIYVPVSGIYLLTVEGDSEMFSAGIIHTNWLEIVLNGTSMASLQYKGKVYVIAGESSELINIAEYRKIISHR